ncbi:gamma-glutamyltransferase [Actinotalea sp. Marseille-Q4924]|uniref:gamma-glutamyltransferase n=1 Tax=Actinotalea sp. Marseille-Q4924 TaxID=2866571 RepID=UPI001CE49137|nr:gamma-glutamyltransferase [Actinotalea sp. Marseille-Q4924]
MIRGRRRHTASATSTRPARRDALRRWAAGGALLLVAGCTTPERAPEEPPVGTSPSPVEDAPTPTPTPTPEPAALGAYGVSSGHPLATRAGMEALEQGGTAVDAAVAAAFADAVMQPASSGIGGGGASIVVADGQALNYDYREVVDVTGTVPASGTGIPGFVAGMARLHEQHGTLEWAALLEPAIRIAEAGGPVSGYLAGTIGGEPGRAVTSGLPHFNRPDGSPLREGDTLVQAELASTMRTLATEGPDAFYTGSLVPALSAVEGIDPQSLSAYAVQESAPARGPVGDYTMLSGAPALPGAAIIQMLQIAEASGIGGVDPASADFVELQSRAWQVAEESVQRSFGDPAFVDVPVEQLTDPQANAAIAAGLGDAARTATGVPYEGAANTTHISVVDADGMAVSMTNTITNYWGSGQYVAGFFMNDQLERFSDIGATDANTPAPGRRSVTWSSPSMLLDGQDRPALVIGTPGGGQIPNTTAQVVSLWALHGQDLEEAVPAERFMLTGGQMRLESDRLRAELEARGYAVRVTPPGSRASYGSVQALEVDWEARTVHGVADTRRSAGVETAVGDPRP